MNKDLLTLKRHLTGALNAMNNLTNGKNSCNDVTECSNCSCKNADRFAKQGHPDTADSVKVASVVAGNKQGR